MSDAPHGQGWWVANDGRWYPPEQHPSQARAQPADSSIRWWGLGLGLLAMATLGLASLAVTQDRSAPPSTASAASPSAAPSDERTPSFEPAPEPFLDPALPEQPDLADPADDALREELTAVLREGAATQGTPLTTDEAGCVANVLHETLGPTAVREAIDSGGASMDALTTDDDPARVLALVDGVLACAPQLLGQ